MKLKFDTSQFISPLIENYFSDTKLSLLKEEIQKSLTVEYYRTINRLASEELNSYDREIYLSGLSIIEEDGGTTLSLSNRESQGIESIGTPTYDMKIGFSQSSKVKLTKRGWYLTIPLPLKTHGAKSSGTKIPRTVYNAIRSGVKKELNLEKGSRNSFIDPMTGKSYDEYLHKSSIFEGIKITKISDRRSSYSTMRRVSNNSDPNSWIKKGKPAVNFFNRAISMVEVNSVVENVLNSYMQ